jgi:hypothetical protein
MQGHLFLWGNTRWLLGYGGLYSVCYRTDIISGKEIAVKKYRLLSVIVGLLVLAFGLSGCGLFRKVATVSGTLEWVDDNTAIEGAEVLIAGLSAISDANGVFTIEKVPYGEHEIAVMFDGISVHTQTVLVDQKDVIVNMSIDWVAEYGSVSGIISWDSGTAIAGAEVSIDGQTVTTAADGSYIIEDVAYGSRNIEVWVEGNLIHTEAILLQEKTMVVNISIIKVGDITGTVKRSAELALAGASVYLMDGTMQVAATNTDHAGIFTFNDVEFGDYVIKIKVGPDELYSGSVTVDSLGTTEIPVITVTTIGGLIWYQDFELAEPGNLPLGHMVFSGSGGELSTTVSYSGSNSWAVEDLHDVSNGMRTISVPITPGKTYKAKTYYAWEGWGAGSFYIEFQDAEFKRINTNSKTLTKETGWSSWELEMVAPENAVYVATIVYYAKSPNDRTTWFDDISIVEVQSID